MSPDSLTRGVRAIEEARQSRVLFLGATSLELEFLPEVFEALRGGDPAEHLDIVLYSRGGSVVAARRLALLFHEFGRKVGVIVAHRCESAGTILSLAAQELVAGPAAMFSPVDPSLEGEGGPVSAIAAEDVRLFPAMAERWFRLPAADARTVELLSRSIFPTTLTSLYRSSLEVEAICGELLALGLPQAPASARAHVVERLLSGYHSHAFSLSGHDLARLGLPVVRQPVVEELAWALTREALAVIGPEAWPGEGAARSDALLVTRGEAKVRVRAADRNLAAKWERLA